MRILDLFSGIGAFSLGLQRAGMTPAAFVEIDEFCRDVLARHWPEVPCHDDVQTLSAEWLAERGIRVDVVCGGFPCQDVSHAGKRAGVAGKRSGLYRQLVRAVRMVRPKVAIVENVAALLGDGMGDVLGDLAEGGNCVEWDCVPACALGACHERDRVWIVAHANGVHGRSGASGEDGAQIGDGPGERAVADASDAQSPGRETCHGDGLRVEPQGGARFGSCEIGQGIAPHPPGHGLRQGWTGRPPDSFARIRDEARRNLADPYGARLAFRAGLGRDAWEELAAAQRSRGEDVEQSIWPDEPALSGVDDEVADWAHRTKATGNCLDPLIPELIGRAILEAIA